MRVRTRSAHLLWIALLLAACRDTATLTRPTTSNAPRSITPKLVVRADTGSTVLVTLALDVSGVGMLGSFTGRVHFASASLEYVGDVAIGDGTTRAINRVGDVVRVAAISTSGVNAARLVTLRFRVIDRTALATMRFDLDEVHELSATNLLSLVRSPNVSRAP
jgi:hypothetical protein